MTPAQLGGTATCRRHAVRPRPARLDRARGVAGSALHGRSPGRRAPTRCTRHQVEALLRVGLARLSARLQGGHEAAPSFVGAGLQTGPTASVLVQKTPPGDRRRRSPRGAGARSTAPSGPISTAVFAPDTRRRQKPARTVHHERVCEGVRAFHDAVARSPCRRRLHQPAILVRDQVLVVDWAAETWPAAAAPACPSSSPSR